MKASVNHSDVKKQGLSLTYSHEDQCEEIFMDYLRENSEDRLLIIS